MPSRRPQAAVPTSPTAAPKRWRPGSGLRHQPLKVVIVARRLWDISHSAIGGHLSGVDVAGTRPAIKQLAREATGLNGMQLQLFTPDRSAVITLHSMHEHIQ